MTMVYVHIFGRIRVVIDCVTFSLYGELLEDAKVASTAFFLIFCNTLLWQY